MVSASCNGLSVKKPPEFFFSLTQLKMTLMYEETMNSKVLVPP